MMCIRHHELFAGRMDHNMDAVMIPLVMAAILHFQHDLAGGNAVAELFEFMRLFTDRLFNGIRMRKIFKGYL